MPFYVTFANKKIYRPHNVQKENMNQVNPEILGKNIRSVSTMLNMTRLVRLSGVEALIGISHRLDTNF